jgi:hypothetical protein
VAAGLDRQRHCADGAGGAADILDDDLLAELLREELRGDAAEPVRATARRVGHDHLQRLVRIVLSKGRRGEKRGAQGTQHGPTTKIHGDASARMLRVAH